VKDYPLLIFVSLPTMLPHITS